MLCYGLGFYSSRVSTCVVCHYCVLLLLYVAVVCYLCVAFVVLLVLLMLCLAVVCHCCCFLLMILMLCVTIVCVVGFVCYCCVSCLCYFCCVLIVCYCCCVSLLCVTCSDPAMMRKSPSADSHIGKSGRPSVVSLHYRAWRHHTSVTAWTVALLPPLLCCPAALLPRVVCFTGNCILHKDVIADCESILVWEPYVWHLCML